MRCRNWLAVLRFLDRVSDQPSHWPRGLTFRPLTNREEGAKFFACEIIRIPGGGDPVVDASHMSELSRRERQIMNVVYRLGRATAAEVAEALPDRPGNSTVRKLLSILEEKGFLCHERAEGNRFLYLPTIPPEEARSSALDQVIETFFKGSATRAAIALLKRSETDVDDEDREVLQRLIDTARRGGR